jgi:hypothetical protein
VGLLVVALMSGAAIPALAQSPPPVSIPGTMALEGTMKMFYRAANTVLVATIDGTEHVYHFTKDLVVHGGKGTGVDALASLQEGATVVVHYTIAGNEADVTEIDRVGDEGLKVTEGIVTHVDRGRNEITLRFANGTTEKLRLTDRAAAEAGPELDRAEPGTTKIVVYYKDEAGRKVTHFVKKVS